MYVSDHIVHQIAAATNLYVLKRFEAAYSVCKEALHRLHQSGLEQSDPLYDQIQLLQLKVSIDLGCSGDVWNQLVSRYQSPTLLPPKILIAGQVLPNMYV
jgi:hypothetical protein